MEQGQQMGGNEHLVPCHYTLNRKSRRDDGGEILVAETPGPLQGRGLEKVIVAPGHVRCHRYIGMGSQDGRAMESELRTHVPPSLLPSQSNKLLCETNRCNEEAQIAPNIRISWDIAECKEEDESEAPR